MSEDVRIFVSHSHHDAGFTRDLVTALRGAGADVWLDKHNLGAEQLGPVVEHELQLRSLFVVVLSPAALASRSVEQECRWAYDVSRRDPARTMLSVLAAPIADDKALWPFLGDFTRVEMAGLQPYPPADAVRLTLLALAGATQGARTAPEAPPSTERAADLVARGKVLQDQEKHAEALSLFEEATQLDPNSFRAWFNLGYTLAQTRGSATKQLAAYERAVALSPTNPAAWTNMGAVLADLKHYAEALAADERAINLDPTDALTWLNKGTALAGLQRYEEALTACERATMLDPNNARAWLNKGNAFAELHRSEEALAAFEHAITLDPTSARAWTGKGNALAELERKEETMAAYERATTLDPAYALAWRNTAIVLRQWGHTVEAEIAEAHARALGT